MPQGQLTVRDKELGECVLDLSIEKSAVDTFIESGFSLDLDRALTDGELNKLQDYFSQRIFEYSMENGSVHHD